MVITKATFSNSKPNLFTPNTRKISLNLKHTDCSKLVFLKYLTTFVLNLKSLWIKIVLIFAIRTWRNHWFSCKTFPSYFFSFWYRFLSQEFLRYFHWVPASWSGSSIRRRRLVSSISSLFTAAYLPSQDKPIEPGKKPVSLSRFLF